MPSRMTSTLAIAQASGLCLFLLLACSSAFLSQHKAASSIAASLIKTDQSRSYSFGLLAAENDADVPAEAAYEEGNGAMNGILNSPLFLKRKIGVLEKELAQYDKELANKQEELNAIKEEWGPRLNKIKTEIANMRKRTNEESGSAADAVTVEVLKEILAVTDNFDRAQQSMKDVGAGEQQIIDYFNSVYQSVIDIFGTMGVTKVEALGVPFDYERHNAVMREPSTEYAEDEVCREFQPGFMLGDLLVRPSLVSVSTGSP